MHLLRHGEVHNPDRVLYGRMPGFGLSELGARQAVAAAEYLAKRPIGYLVSSPLERAQQTAAPLAELTGLPVAARRAADRGGEPPRRPRRRRRQGAVRRPDQLALLPQPVPPVVGRAIRRDRRTDAGRPSGQLATPPTGPAKGGGRVHQPPAADRDRPPRTRRAEHLFHDPRRRQCALGSVTSFTFDGDAIVEVDYAEPAADAARRARRRRLISPHRAEAVLRRPSRYRTLDGCDRGRPVRHGARRGRRGADALSRAAPARTPSTRAPGSTGSSAAPASARPMTQASARRPATSPASCSTAARCRCRSCAGKVVVINFWAVWCGAVQDRDTRSSTRSIAPYRSQGRRLRRHRHQGSARVRRRRSSRTTRSATRWSSTSRARRRCRSATSRARAAVHRVDRQAAAGSPRCTSNGCSRPTCNRCSTSCSRRAECRSAGRHRVHPRGHRRPAARRGGRWLRWSA